MSLPKPGSTETHLIDGRTQHREGHREAPTAVTDVGTG